MIARNCTRAGGLAALLLGLVAGGCASSTGAVPKPFPMPGSPAPRARAGRAEPPRPAAAAPTSDAAGISEEGMVDNDPTVAAPPPVEVTDLVARALAFRGVPYRNGGADPTGFDCSGFTQYVFAQAGVALPRAVHEQFRIGTPIQQQDVVAGDLLFFTTVAPGASHVGIAIDGDQFVHAPSSTGVVRVERLSARYWAQRYLGARRVK